MKEEPKPRNKSSPYKEGTKPWEKPNAEPRKVCDNIHGFIQFDQIIWNFIDTPEFQRMRKIKQLGCLEYVFPGATHTRFEHSLGTAHLALTFLNVLIDKNPQQYQHLSKEVLEQARLTITLAGLLHDIGHGPYSHTFDSRIVETIEVNGPQKIKKWSHEIASQRIFEYMMEKQSIKSCFQPEQFKRVIERVINLIHGKKTGERQWEFEIISNEGNGIDVDKLDYFRRDAFHLGAKNIHINHELLMKEARIIGTQICYPSKYVQDIHNIFHSRYKLYKNYYGNVISKGIELMICDILQELNHVYNFRQICRELNEGSPQKYLKLNDHIIEKVQDIYTFIQNNEKLPEKDIPSNVKEIIKLKPNFKKALDLIHRISTRKIYKFVREVHYFLKEGIKPEIQAFLSEQLKEEKIINQISSTLHISPEQICVSKSKIGFGKEMYNPLKKVGFFKKQLKQYETRFRQLLSEAEIQDLTMLYSDLYLQRSVKIFIKKDDQPLFDRVSRAFKQYCIVVNNRCENNYKEFLQEKGKKLKLVVFGREGNTPFHSISQTISPQNKRIETNFGATEND